MAKERLSRYQRTALELLCRPGFYLDWHNSAVIRNSRDEYTCYIPFQTAISLTGRNFIQKDVATKSHYVITALGRALVPSNVPEQAQVN